MADTQTIAPDYSRVSIVPVAVLAPVIACSVAALRFLAARGPLAKWRLEAVHLLLAVAFALVCMGASISMYLNGLGLHSSAVSDAQLSVFLKMLWLDGLASTLSLTCAKLSILFLYLRLLTFQAPRVLCKAFIVFTAVTHLWIIISALTACVPLSSLWNSAAVHGTHQHVYCHPRDVFWLDFGLGVAANMLIFTLPIPLMFYVVVPKIKHVALFAMPLFGYGICAVSAVRAATHVTHTHSNDSTSTSVSYVNLTVAEVSLTIIWACVFGLRYIFDPLYETQDHPAPFISHAEKIETTSPIFPHNIPPEDLHHHQQNPVRPLPVAATTTSTAKHRPMSSQDSVPWGQNITRYSSSLFTPSSSSCALIAAANNNMAPAPSTSTFTLSLMQTLADAASDDASDDEPDISLASALAAAHRRRASDASGFLPIFAHSDPADTDDDACVTDKDGRRRSYKIINIPRSTTPNSLRFAMPPKPKPLRLRGGAVEDEDEGNDDAWMAHPGERRTLTVPIYAPAQTWWG